MQKNNQLTLNDKQLQAYSYITNGKNIFLTGPAGVGKTSIIKLYKSIHNNKNIVVTSTTGTSALLINGITFHSYLGIGCGNDSIDYLLNKINSKQWLKKRWKQIECLFIDEVSMLDPILFDKLEEIARKIRNNNSVFGGIQIILSGDFLQLPCVGTNNFCFQSKSWDICIDNTIYLDKIIRQCDNEFQNILNKIRLGNIDDDVKKILDKRLKVELKNCYGIKPTKLFSKNHDVNLYNENELDILSGDNREFYEYEMKVSIYASKNQEVIKDKFYKNTNLQNTLQLCVGAQVMLLKNIDLNSGLANGSRGVITKFINNIPMVQFLNGQNRLIDFLEQDIEENGELILSAKQIPLKVAYALSIHKSQGCSLDYAEIDLSNIFEYGQAYVALSRVKNLEGLSISAINYELIKAHPIAVEYYKKISE